jgi:hypothetical protein
MPEPFNAVQHTIDKLIESGRYAEAGKLALKAGRPAPAEPADEGGSTDGGQTLSHEQLKGLSREQMAELRTNHPDVYRRSVIEVSTKAKG